MWKSCLLFSNKSSSRAYIRWPVPDGPYLTNMSAPMARPSLDLGIELGENVRVAKGFQSQFESSDLHLRKKVKELNAHNMEDGDDGLDSENRDPAVVATDVAAQIVGPRRIF